jgi:adenylate cyclase
LIQSSDISKARILVVDDLEANVILLEQMLAGAGYTRVTSTMRPDQVCELHLRNPFDLIILDLMMPGMDGFAVMENLKTIETGGYIPVLVITAQSDHKLRALKAGARDFISKPFELAEVLARVRNLLEVRLLHMKSLELNAKVEAEQDVTRRLLGDLMPHPDTPGNWGELAVLLQGIAGFTAFSEKAEPEILAGILDAIAHRQDSEGISRDGIVREAYLLTSELPSERAVHTVEAVEKALDLAEALDRFNENKPFKLTFGTSKAAYARN